MKKFYTRSIMLLFSIAMVFSSCSKTESDITVSDNREQQAELKGLNTGSTVQYDLLAAEIIVVGTVSITKKGGMIIVEYETVDGWSLSSTDIHAEYNWQDIPQTSNGNPIIGQFDYKDIHDPLIQYFVRVLDEDFFGCFYIAVHAEVVKGTSTEQAWGDGIDFPGTQWSMYIYFVPPWVGKPI